MKPLPLIDKIERIREREKIDRKAAKSRLEAREKRRKQAIERAKSSKGRFLPDLGKAPTKVRATCRRKNLRSVFYREVGTHDWKVIIGMSVRCAKEGCHLCRDWLGKYILGTPPNWEIEDKPKQSDLASILPDIRELQELAELELDES